MSTETFQLENYDVLYNTVPPAMIFSFNNLLQRSTPTIVRCTDQSIRKMIANGAHIITIIHNGTNIIAGLGIFLPIDHESGRYHEKRIAIVHEEQKSFAPDILRVIDAVAKDFLAKTNWKKITYTRSEQWDTLFHH